jgi:hypothetical protein
LLLLYAHRRQNILGAAGLIIMTPANQLMVMGLQIWSLSNLGFELGTSVSITGPTRLPAALTGPTERD